MNQFISNTLFVVFAILGSILDSRESSMFQLARWSHELVLFPIRNPVVVVFVVVDDDDVVVLSQKTFHKNLFKIGSVIDKMLLLLLLLWLLLLLLLLFMLLLLLLLLI